MHCHCCLVDLFDSIFVFIKEKTLCSKHAGTFKLTLQFTEDYPNKPPTVRFVSRMFHPNSELENHFDISLCFIANTFHHINSHLKFLFPIWSVYADGSICLDILQNQWSPIYDVAAILTSIQVILHCFVNLRTLSFVSIYMCESIKA